MSDIPKAWRKPRPISGRLYITGLLELESPAHFGSGDPDPMSYVDMTLLKDPLEGKALLPGASLAGALRNYLWEREFGYNYLARKSAGSAYQKKVQGAWATQLFGGLKGDDEGKQSLVIVDDALADISALELRDSVRINPATRTAKDEQLFSMELLPAGTTFKIAFEVLIPEKGPTQDSKTPSYEYSLNFLKALILALQGLEAGEMTLGARKRRGFGHCKVSQWRVDYYDFTAGKGAGLLGWLNHNADSQPLQKTGIAQAIAQATGKQFAPLTLDNRAYFDLNATFVLDGSLLIRSGFGSLPGSPEIAHLHITRVNGKPEPIIPGTSFAGVIRHRALRIAKTVYRDTEKANKLIDQMFGRGNEDDDEDKLTASQVIVEDAPLEAAVKPMVQTRVKIDRFTGGAFETALINEEPVWGKPNAAFDLKLRLRNPQEAEIGLLLLVLKDLWTGDLPIGGESSIGRGRLQGKEADLTWRTPEVEKSWKIIQQAEGLQITSVTEKVEILQTYVDSFNRWEGKNGQKD